MAEKRAEAKAANEVEMARLKLKNQLKRAVVKVLDVEIIPVHPPIPAPAAAQDDVNPERCYFEWKFKVGDYVHTYADTQQNVRGNRGECFRGTVAAMDYNTRLVTIKSLFTGRMHPAIHESSVFVDSKSVNGNDCRDTRAATADPDIHLQRELDQKKKENLKHEITIAAMRARLDALEEAQPAIRHVIWEMRVLDGEIEQLKTNNAILNGIIRDMAPSTSAREIFSRKGPSEDATPVMKAIRAIYLEKLFEGEERDEAAQQDIADLNARIVVLTMKLKAEVQAEVELKREIKRMNGETKRQAKELEEHEVAAELDQEKKEFEDSLTRRLQYVISMFILYHLCSNVPAIFSIFCQQ